MGWRDGTIGAADFGNDDGCPYINQTLLETVQNWPQVLASIDFRSLPIDLQAELYQLRHKYADRSLNLPA